MMIHHFDYIETAGMSRQEFELAVESFEKAGARIEGPIEYGKPYLGVTGVGHLHASTAPMRRRLEWSSLRALGWDGRGLPPKGALVKATDEVRDAFDFPVNQWRPGDLIECIDHKEVEGVTLAVFWNRSHETASALMSSFYAIEWDSMVHDLAEALRPLGHLTLQEKAQALINQGWTKE